MFKNIAALRKERLIVQRQGRPDSFLPLPSAKQNWGTPAMAFVKRFLPLRLLQSSLAQNKADLQLINARSKQF
jgi:hypothetical protein